MGYFKMQIHQLDSLIHQCWLGRQQTRQVINKRLHAIVQNVYGLEHWVRYPILPITWSFWHSMVQKFTFKVETFKKNMYKLLIQKNSQGQATLEKCPTLEKLPPICLIGNLKLTIRFIHIFHFKASINNGPKTNYRRITCLVLVSTAHKDRKELQWDDRTAYCCLQQLTSK